MRWPPTKHGTASVFVLRRTPERSEIAVIWHAGLGKWLVPGGHIEVNETPADAGHREVVEEIGCRVTLFDASLVRLSGAIGERPSPAPLAVVEEVIPQTYGMPEHVHIDHLFAAALDVQAPRLQGENTPRWVGHEDLASLDMFRITREIAEQLLRVGSVLGDRVLASGMHCR